MVSKKQNPPPKPVVEEESSDEEEEVEEEIEEEIEEEEEEGHEEKPQVSSSVEEDGEGEGEETDSNEEEDQSSISKRNQPSIQNVKKQPTALPAVVRNSVSEGEETESEGETEEEEELTNAEPISTRSPTVSDYTVRPITNPANTKGSKANTKRPLEEASKGSGNGKKAKTGEENDKKGKGGSFPGRIWNEESEVIVLQGMIDYQKRYGSFRPTVDVGIFSEFIKKKLWDGVTKNQISDKIKRAKTKFSQIVKKGKNGQHPVFSKPHDKIMFDLSNQIWGTGSDTNGTEDKAKVKGDDGKGKKVGNSGSENKKIEDNVKGDNPKGKKGDNAGSASIHAMDVDKDEKQDLKMDDNDDDEDFLSKFPTLSKSFDAELGFLKENLHLIGNQKARELEEKWRQLRLEEIDVIAKRFNMMSEQIKMVLDAMKKQ